MFRKTIAVGPLEPAAFCVTGGACVVASFLLERLAVTVGVRAGMSGERPAERKGRAMPYPSRDAERRKAMMESSQKVANEIVKGGMAP